ncbi:hypothetical protein B0H17DRAFT_1159245 [Mycena rosella]|uniref:Uncharacterized protein n=1 Tax=Mycena rosella TaxID=1033263 RepID=A0AAD7DL03_MYCRO|nr:hypothetical protein B0H17DRAFT_1159245 [Mycena rosella]
MVNKRARTSNNGSLLFEPEIVEPRTTPASTMSQSSTLFTLARSKLNLSVDSKDSFSLHRWVLLKNSIVQSLPLLTASSSSSSGNASASEEDYADDEGDSFMFPDAGKLVEGPTTEVNASEAAWLDSLLETLGEDDDDDFNPDPDVHASVVPVDDDEDLTQSPPISPMSSSDDLTTQSYYPYLVPYPPSAPRISYHFNPPLASSPPPPYVDPLPYCDFDDLDDFPPVPDAIEDTSDDESEAPPTPGQSLSSLSLDPASIPLPTEHSRLRHSTPHIYIDTEDDDEYFYPFDPLPFPNDLHTPVTYQEC